MALTPLGDKAVVPRLSPRLLFHDPWFLACDKPSGLLVHPSTEATDRYTAMHWARDVARQWVYAAHRLDRAASGVTLFALSPEAVAAMQARWFDETTIKEYWALVRGETPTEGVIDRPLTDDAGEPRASRTHYRRLALLDGFSLLTVTIDTGRRHQIRRHLAGLAHQLAGDTSYGKGGVNRSLRQDVGLHRLFLHAHSLSFSHPFTNEAMTIKSAMPPELSEPLRCLGASDSLLRDL